MPEPVSPITYTGWLRAAGDSWEPVCSAPDLESCWSLLLDTPCPTKIADRTVLAQGRHPEDPT